MQHAAGSMQNMAVVAHLRACRATPSFIIYHSSFIVLSSHDFPQPPRHRHRCRCHLAGGAGGLTRVMAGHAVDAGEERRSRAGQPHRAHEALRAARVTGFLALDHQRQPKAFC